MDKHKVFDLSVFAQDLVEQKFTDVQIKFIDDQLELKPEPYHKIALVSISKDYFGGLFKKHYDQLSFEIRVPSAIIMRDLIRSYYGLPETEDVPIHLRIMGEILCKDFLCIPYGTSELEGLVVPPEDFELLVDVVQIFKPSFKLFRLLKINIPSTYDISLMNENMYHNILLFDGVFAVQVDQLIEIWNIQKLTKLRTIDRSGLPCATSMTFSKKNTHLCICLENGTIECLDILNSKLMTELSIETKENANWKCSLNMLKNKLKNMVIYCPGKHDIFEYNGYKQSYYKTKKYIVIKIWKFNYNSIYITQNISTQMYYINFYEQCSEECYQIPGAQINCSNIYVIGKYDIIYCTVTGLVVKWCPSMGEITYICDMMDHVYALTYSRKTQQIAILTFSISSETNSNIMRKPIVTICNLAGSVVKIISVKHSPSDSFVSETSDIYSIDFSPDGKMIVYRNNTGSHIYDVDSGTLIVSFENSRNGIFNN